MIDFLMSDPAILLLSAVGLVATGVSIIRDTRAQRARASVEQLPVSIDSEKIAA